MMQVLLGDKEYFKGINQIKYEGPKVIIHLRFAGMMRTR